MENKYLERTKLLNFEAESIQTLIKSRGWLSLDEYHRIGAIYDFVRNEVLFGYNRSDTLTAEEVLRDGYGQCNTKATLLMALLRGAGIPCRLHGTEVSKYFQRGATSALLALFAPKLILHSWAEVLYDNKWIALEGVITDEGYIRALKERYRNADGSFAKYAVAVRNLQSLDLNWQGRDSFVQNEAVVTDYGVFESPDVFFSRHRQTWGRFKNFVYVHYGRKVMTTNVAKMRNRNIEK